MDKKLQAQLNRCLTELCLATARSQYLELAEQAQSETLSYPEYLLSVLESECQSRRMRRIDRRLHESRLPFEKNLETFDLKRLPKKVTQQIKTLLDGDFINHNENVLVFGNPGSGKTHLICALAQELIRQDKRIYFSTCALLLQDLLLAKKDLRLPRLLKNLADMMRLLLMILGMFNRKKKKWKCFLLSWLSDMSKAAC